MNNSSAAAAGARETWTTRGAFVLAAIGSAVGLGNLWGFPYKVYAFGGGAFLIPYFIAMAVMGIPLLIMEFAVGHWAQQSAPGAFRRILTRYRFVGWWLVTLAFVIITYYAVILAYCIDYLVVSVLSLGSGSLPWSGPDAAGAQAYFFDDMLRFSNTMALGPPAGRVLAATLAVWLLIYLCLFRGVKWISRVVLLTVPLPWIMLLVLTIRGLTLEGAIAGLEFYLEPRWAKLLDPDTWRFAFGQVFFSMSLGFAVMLSYASFLHRRSDLNNNALIIGLGDLGTSFVAGIAVFSMLGAMAAASGTAVPDLVPEGTVGLSFVVFPFGLTQLPAAALFSSVFFLALLTLGIDSAFSIVEACLASVCDSRPLWPRRYVLPAICAAGMVCGLVFTSTRGGLNWLALVDGLINGPLGILVVALAESLVVGWAWNGRFLGVMRAHANERSDWRLYGWWDFTVKYVVPAFLSILIAWSVIGEVHRQLDAHAADPAAYRLPWTLIAGSAVFAGVPAICWLLSRFLIPRGSRRRRENGVARGVAYAATIALLAAIAIETAHRAGRFAGREAAFTPDGQLDGTAYAFLALGLVTIFGGLLWCLWRALLAAGLRDPEMKRR